MSDTDSNADHGTTGGELVSPVDLDLAFFRVFADAAAPSGYESAAAELWLERAARFGARTERSVHGAAVARFGSGRPRVALVGHLDEIGLAVTHVDDDGFVWCRPIGGWEPLQAVGQRLRVIGEDAEGNERVVAGVVGRAAPHLRDDDDRKAPRWRDLWIDIGAADGDEARRHVAPGAWAVVDRDPVELLGRRVSGRALDDRLGAWAVLEAAARAAEHASEPAFGEVVAVATTHEEIGGPGAPTALYALEPDAVVVVDATHATDTPGGDPKREGECALGSGANLAVGSYLDRPLLRTLRRLAGERGVPVTLAPQGARTATDADFVAGLRGGVPTALVSIPLRSMHSPAEVADLGDVASVVTLLAAFAASPELPPER